MKRNYVNRLPKNEEVKNTNVRIENGELVVEVEFKEKFKPKFGDIVKAICPTKGTKRDYMICIVPEHDYDIYNIANIDKGGNLSYVCGKDNQTEIQPASESEKQELFNKLAEVGKRWNAEKKCLEDIRWRAKKGEIYYYVDNCALVTTHGETFDMIDNIRYDLCNYFRHYESAQKVADQIKEIFKNSKAE